MFTSPVVQVTFNLSTLFTGLSHSPRPDKAEISFSINDPQSYEAYVTQIKEFLKAYDDVNQNDDSKFEDCNRT